jgi:hypothetical protein
MKRIAPGLYDDGEGGLHLAIDELLRAHGYADTPANVERLTAIAQQAIEERFSLPVTVTTDPIGEPTEE